MLKILMMMMIIFAGLCTWTVETVVPVFYDGLTFLPPSQNYPFAWEILTPI